MTTALATIGTKVATRFGMGSNTDEVMDILKITAFKGAQVSDAQMTALMVVADQYGLNPFTREIYAFPDKGGIVPVVGVDGWSRIINEHPQFDGMEFEQDADSCTCIMFRKDRGHAVKVTEWLSECKRDNAQPWKSHPKRMLRHKALIQCARLAFGFVGIYDADEAERLLEVDTNTGEIKNKRVTPESAAASNISDDFEQYEADVFPIMQDAAKNGTQSLSDAFGKLETGKNKTAFWTKHGKALKGAAEKSNVVDVEDIPQ